MMNLDTDLQIDLEAELEEGFEGSLDDGVNLNNNEIVE